MRTHGAGSVMGMCAINENVSRWDAGLFLNLLYCEVQNVSRDHLDIERDDSEFNTLLF